MKRARAPVRNRLKIRRNVFINISFPPFYTRTRSQQRVSKLESNNSILEKVSIPSGGFCKKVLQEVVSSASTAHLYTIDSPPPIQRRIGSSEYREKSGMPSFMVYKYVKRYMMLIQ